jgi:hypothetical protein
MHAILKEFEAKLGFANTQLADLQDLLKMKTRNIDKLQEQIVKSNQDKSEAEFALKLADEKVRQHIRAQTAAEFRVREASIEIDTLKRKVGYVHKTS